MNESVSQLYHFSDLFRLHVDWLKSARGNVSLPTQPTEGASKHLLQLTHLLNSTLHQVRKTSTEVKMDLIFKKLLTERTLSMKR